MSRRPLARSSCLWVAILLAPALGACSDDHLRALDPDAGGGCTAGQPGCPPADSTAAHVPEPVLPPSTEGVSDPIRLGSTLHDWLLSADASLRLVSHLDGRTLKPLGSFRVRGRPMGVAFLGSAFYVANLDARSIDVHDADGGRFKFSVSLGRDAYPNDLEADYRAGLLFVLDGAKAEVGVFDASGRRVRTISGKGDGADRLQAPVGLGLDETRQRVMVSDYGPPLSGVASVKIFSYDGVYVGTIRGSGSCGTTDCPDGFSRPQSPAVDAQGRIWVPDAVQATLMVFDGGTLRFQRRVGDRSLFRVPTDIVFDSVGNAFVANRGARRVQVLRGVGAS